MNGKKTKDYTVIWVLVVLAAVVICGMFSLINSGTGFLWFLAIVNICVGPCIFVGYILEVRKGIFKADDEEAE